MFLLLHHGPRSAPEPVIVPASLIRGVERVSELYRPPDRASQFTHDGIAYLRAGANVYTADGVSVTYNDFCDAWEEYTAANEPALRAKWDEHHAARAAITIEGKANPTKVHESLDEIAGMLGAVRAAKVPA